MSFALNTEAAAQLPAFTTLTSAWMSRCTAAGQTVFPRALEGAKEGVLGLQADTSRVFQNNNSG